MKESGMSDLFRQQRMATPRKSDADRGGRGDVLSQLQGHASRHAGTMPTPVKNAGGRRLSAEAVRTGRRENGAKAQIDTPNLLRHMFETLPTPTATRYGSQSYAAHPEIKRPSLESLIRSENLPTPTKRDSRMDAWSPAHERRKSPSMDAVMSGAMKSLTPTATGNQMAPSMRKWAGARALAAMLRSHGLTGTAALPITYGWMMGFPPGWLARALRSALESGRLRPA
jgi:hypothetical protein